MERLNARQFQTLSDLVSIPSAYSQMKPVCDEVELQESIWSMLQDPSIRLSRQQMEDEGRFNIIAQKGCPIEQSRYVVMVYVHTDTIKKKKVWKESIDYELVRDNEFLRGVGVYDMKAGVMTLIDTLQTVDLPEGITLVGAFCVGEERDSDGVEKLMEWPHIDRVCIVLSPEIGSMGNDPNGEMRERDAPKDIIVGRPGNVKSILTVTASESHAYAVDQPDANEALRTALNHLFAGFARRGGSDLRSHPDFGKERMRERHVQTLDSDDGEFESVATGAIAKLAMRIVPPTTIGEIRAWQQRSLGDLMQAGRWAECRLGGEFSKFGMSYDPYVIRTDSLHAQAVFEAAAQHYGSYTLSPGQAVADGAYAHWYMNRKRGIEEPSNFTQFSIRDVRSPDQRCLENYVPWIDIGPLGQGAHKRTERVYEASLVKLIGFYHHYLTCALPENLGRRDA